MRSLIINLDRSSDRLEAAKVVFRAAGIELERVSAVDENHLAHTMIASVTAPSLSKYRQWDRGAVGCTLSHVRAWQAIAAGPDQFVAVFEDDNRISPDLGNILADTSWIPEGADLIRLETHLRPQALSSTPFPACGNRRLIEIGDHFTTGSSAYIMSRTAALRALEMIKEDYLPSDRSLYDKALSSVAASMRSFQMDPAPCAQDHCFDDMTFASTITAAKLQLSLLARIKRRIAKKVPKLRQRVGDWRSVPFA